MYFLSLPDDGSILVMNQWGSWTVKGRVTPDWFAPVDIMNIPGALIGRTCLWAIGLRLPNQVTWVLFGQIAGTLFWGVIAVIVEFAWTRRRRVDSPQSTVINDTPGSSGRSDTPGSM